MEEKNLINHESPMRIAQIMGKMENGGVESVVMNYYRHIDRTKIQFDFIVDSDSSCPQKKEILSLGGNVYFVNPYQNIKNNMKDLECIFNENKYEIVHSELTTMSVFSLKAAKQCGIPIRICHGHNTAGKGETKKNILKYLLRPFSKIYATNYFACSKYAGQWLFGRKILKNNNFMVLKNAIDVEKFKFNNNIRNDIRNKYNLNGKFVIGHVGRFCYQKNHNFLIDIFNEIYKLDKSAVLILIGEGEFVNQIKEKVNKLGLDDVVLFCGTCNNINEFYQAMDVFVLPSYYEGLGIVAIESQASGLFTICSDKTPIETKLCNNIEYMSLDNSALYWANVILDKKNYIRKDESVFVKNNGYDINTEAKKLEDFYFNIRKG